MQAQKLKKEFSDKNYELQQNIEKLFAQVRFEWKQRGISDEMLCLKTVKANFETIEKSFGLIEEQLLATTLAVKERRDVEINRVNDLVEPRQVINSNQR